MIKANKYLADKKIPKKFKKVLETTCYPKVEGVIYKLKGEIGENLYVTYLSHYDALFYAGVDRIHSHVKDANNTKELLKEMEGYRSLHDNDYEKRMKPVLFTKDFDGFDKLKKYKFKN